MQNTVLFSALLAFGLACSGCSTYFTLNQPLESWDKASGYRSSRRWSAERSDELLLVLAFSGGGTRASAFAYGVLEQLADTEIVIGGKRRRLLDEVDHISAVSGGSFTAAYYGLYGDRIFEDYESRFLDRDVQTKLLLKLMAPWNWVRMASPYYERGDLAAEAYNEYLFEDATYADMIASLGPFIQINATDIATGHPFSFIQEQFDFLCSDLASYPVARAVAASSAVPGVFTPLTLRNFAGKCGFAAPAWIDEEMRTPDAFSRAYVNAANLRSYLDADRRRYIRVVDGGISDNLGVRGPFESQVLSDPRQPRRPEIVGNLRNIVLVLVNAATTPEAAWENSDVSMTLSAVLQDATTVQINRYSLETMELLRSNFEAWNRTASRWKSPAQFHLVEVDFTKLSSAEERAYINKLPTSFTLGEGAVDRLRAAARGLLAESPPYLRFLQSVQGGEITP